ncbi:MAG: PHP domain-containing protein [Clostridium sp.]|nr:PHP domain-containing protein [Clostridium sp.]MDU7083970.1 PHP domain-containing protein [Clostridium sp.]
MIIDTHMHENKYSFDSLVSFDEIIEQAKKVGLDGICITNHDNADLIKETGSFFYKDGILVLVGAEVLTTEGDIVVFGVEDLPRETFEPNKLTPEELLTIVNNHNGAAIAAHPYRTNNRGLGDNIKTVAHILDGVEAFNGSTPPHHNLMAYTTATECSLGIFGASDCHVKNKVGCYATEFNCEIKTMNDFIKAIKSKNYCPVILKDNGYERINIYDTLK